MTPADKVLSQLSAVRKGSGAGRYVARCPAHEDRSASLSIRELDDGRVLIHCFAGCDTQSVLAAMSLSMDDLYPDKNPTWLGKGERRPFNASDALRNVAFESLVVMTAAAAILAGEPLSAMDRERLSVAVNRIQSALSACGIRLEGM